MVRWVICELKQDKKVNQLNWYNACGIAIKCNDFSECAMETVYSKHLVHNKLSFKGKAILKQTRNMKSLDVLTQIA